MVFKFAVFSLLFLLTSCAIVRGSFTPLSDHTYPAKQPDYDLLLSTKEVNRPYREIGIIVIKANRRGEEQGKIYGKFKEIALQAGADGVIRINCGSALKGHWGPTGGFVVSNTHCQGTAIVFDNQQ